MSHPLELGFTAAPMLATILRGRSSFSLRRGAAGRAPRSTPDRAPGVHGKWSPGDQPSLGDQARPAPMLGTQSPIHPGRSSRDLNVAPRTLARHRHRTIARLRKIPDAELLKFAKEMRGLLYPLRYGGDGKPIVCAF